MYLSSTARRRNSAVIVFSAALLYSAAANAAIIAGDIAITGMITNGSPDSFMFVTLAPIAAGEVIYFTDNGWDGSEYRGASGSDGDGNENLIKFTVNNALPAGTVVRTTSTSPNYTWTRSGSIPGTSAGSFDDLSLGQSGEQIYAFQGPNSNPLNNPSGHIFVYDDSNGFENASDSSSGNIPPGLSIAGNTAVTLNQSSSTTKYFNWGTLGSGTKAQWLAAIKIAANWTTGSGALPTTGSIVVNSSVTVTPSSGNLAPGTAVVAIAISGGNGGTLGSLSISGLGWSTSGLAAGAFTTAQNLNAAAASSGRLNGTMRGRTSFVISGDTNANATYSYTLATTITGQTASPGSGTTFGTAQSSTLLTGDKFTGQNSVEGAGGLGKVATLVDSTALPGDTNISISWRNRSSRELYPGLTPPLPDNISSLITDVINVNLGANAPSTYVLQMSYNPSSLGGISETYTFNADHLYLAFMTAGGDGQNGTSDDAWVHAGTAPFNPTYLRGYTGTDLNTPGAWGVDTVNHVAWAVLPSSRQGQFAVVPEPNSLGLLAIGAMGLLSRRRR